MIGSIVDVKQSMQKQIKAFSKQIKAFENETYHLLNDKIETELKEQLAVSSRHIFTLENMTHHKLDDKVQIIEKQLRPIRDKLDEFDVQINTLDNMTNYKLDNKVEAVDAEIQFRHLSKQVNYFYIKFKTLENETNGKLDDKFESIEKKIRPMKKQLGDFSVKIETLENEFNRKLDNAIDMASEMLQPMEEQLGELSKQIKTLANETSYKLNDKVDREGNHKKESKNHIQSQLDDAVHVVDKDVSDSVVKVIKDTIRQSVTGKDCKDIKAKSGFRLSGLYTITLPVSGDHVTVYCDMETAGGGWTVLQRRFDGSEDFYRNFNDYEHGFGNIENGEFWLVNHLVIFSFNSFYLLRRIDAFPALTYNNKRPFSTYDRDLSYQDCPITDRAGWWYSFCAFANPNGQHVTPVTTSDGDSGSDQGGLTYSDFGEDKGLKTSKMMFRRRD